MGTSKAYKGRPDNRRLLPPEAQQPVPPASPPEPPPPGQTPPIPPQDQPRLPPITFQQARRIANAAVQGLVGGAAGAGGRATYGKAASSYVRASGGPKIAAQASVAGRQGAQQLMGFLGGVAENGIIETARRFRMGDLANLPPNVVLQRVVDAIFPNANTREEALARNCGAKTLQEWLSKFDLSNGDIAKIDSTDLNDVPELIKDYLVNYVADRMDNELLTWVERSGDMDTALKLSQGMHDYVSGQLENILRDFENTADPASWVENMEEISEKLFEEAYALIEVPQDQQDDVGQDDNESESSDEGEKDD